MITFDATQNAIVGADWKKLTWLFEVTESGSGSPDHYWSTKDYTYDAQAYTAKVLPDSFGGINTARPRSEYGIQAPDDLAFTVENDGGGITASDLVDAVVHVKLVMADNSDEEIIRQFKFVVRRAFDEYEAIRITCEDYLQRFLKGDYPNTPRTKTIFPSDDAEAYDDLCVPVPFGTAYIPLRSVYITDARYYLLGLSSHTYTITEVHSPRDWSTTSTWTSGSYTFTQSTKADDDATDWRVFQPIIADSDSDGTADANGLWYESGRFRDALVKFTRDDTASLTGPEDVIEFVLEDMGVPSADIDTGGGSTFETAGTTYTGWTLAFNGGFFYKRPREEVLAQLVTMCHSILSVEDKVRLRVYDTTSRATLTDADIRKGTWSWQPLDEEDYDSAYIAIPTAGEPQDVLKKYRVTATGNYDNISDEVLEIPFVSDTQDAQKIGMLHFEYKFLKSGQASFTAHEKHLALEPGDWITINDTPYGASKKVLIDAMRITRDGAVELTVITYSTEPDDWGDLSPSAISPASDDSTTYWSPVVSGPDATVDTGVKPNVMVGRLLVGSGVNHILLDPADPIIKLDEGGTDRMLIGKLGVDNYGMQINDAAGNTLLQIDSSQSIVQSADWGAADGMQIDLAANTITVRAGSGLVIDSSGGVSVSAGGDITLTGNDTGPGVLALSGTGRSFGIACKTDGSQLAICPTTSDGSTLLLGNSGSDWGDWSTYKFSSVKVLASGTFYARLIDATDENAFIVYPSYALLSRAADADSYLYFKNQNSTNGAKIGVGSTDNLIIEDLDANDVSVRTNSTGALTIDSSQNVRHIQDGAAGGPFLSTGAGNDLKLFHNGSDSFVYNTTGELRIYNAANDVLRFYVNSAVALTIAASKDCNFAGNIGIGKSPNSPLDINLTTEDLEIVDAGSADATEQDWIEVEVGGNTGYIRVHAAK